MCVYDKTFEIDSGNLKFQAINTVTERQSDKTEKISLLIMLHLGREGFMVILLLILEMF